MCPHTCPEVFVCVWTCIRMCLEVSGCVQKCPEVSRRVQMCPYVSGCVRMCPDVPRCVQICAEVLCQVRSSIETAMLVYVCSCNIFTLYSRSPTGGTPYVTKFTRVKFTFYIFKLNNICMYRINIPNFDNKC